MVSVIKLRADAPDPPPVRFRDYFNVDLFIEAAIIGGIILALALAWMYREDLFRLAGKLVGTTPDTGKTDMAAPLISDLLTEANDILKQAAEEL